MITVRRSKVELMQAYHKHMQLIPSEDCDIELLINYLNDLSSYAEKLKFTEEFTEEEFMNTFNFVKLLNKELYEKLIGYKIIED